MDPASRNPSSTTVSMSSATSASMSMSAAGLAVSTSLPAVPSSSQSRGLPYDQVLAMRSQYMCSNLALSYKPKPLMIVKGRGSYLYDEKGNAYLDCVNNVSHVGHCHPRVVKAAQDQIAELNTNSRYLHESMVVLAKEVLATMPAPLSKCIFCCSGSEANELALRMAKAYSGQKDVIILEGAYHGTTNNLIDLSPYKYEGRGGYKPPATTHKVMLADAYRGKYRADNPLAGELYAADVKRAIDEIKAAGRGVSAFLAESISGCGGQVPFPPNYLKAAYKHVRDAGGVCIADEVQTGFGRVGSHFWAFELQGVVPDIVVIGKPMANGMPISAVIVTPEVAAAFDNGMEYFNTYGGNPVVCATALATLRTIKDEHLQENAHAVGEYIMDALRKMQTRHPLIGDVRGHGLFIGVELVRDHKTLTPADRETYEVTMTAKERGVLLSADGRHNNVIKIKPPIVFSKKDADFMLAELDRALTLVESKSRTASL